MVPHGATYEPTWAHMGPCGPIWDHMGPYGPTWDHNMGPYGPIRAGPGRAGSGKLFCTASMASNKGK